MSEPGLIEDALRRQSRLFSDTQAVAHIGVWEWEVGQPTVMWSPELYRIYGVAPEDYTPTFEGYLAKVHPRDRVRVRSAIEEAFVHQTSFSQDEQILRPDGSIRQLHTWGHAVSDSEGHLARLIGVCQDITEQRAAEERVRRSEERYRLIVENAAEGIWLSDADSRTIFVNGRIAEILGYTVDEMKGRSVFHFMDRAHRDEAKVQLFKRRQGARGHFEFPLRRKDGSRVWTSVSISPLFGEDGTYAGALAVIDDITWRRQSQVLLAAQRDMFDLLATGGSLTGALTVLVVAIETLIEGVISSVLLLDENTRTLVGGVAPNLPDAFTQAIDGAPIGPVAGSCGTAAYRGDLVIVEDVEIDPLWADYRQLAKAHGLRACWSSPIFSSDCNVLGTFAMYFRDVRRPTEADIRLVRDAAGAAALAIEHIRARDSLAKALLQREAVIEQERHAKLEAQKAVQLREDFISIASHELRTPLTPLNIQTQLLEQLSTHADLQATRTWDELRRLIDGLGKQVNRLLKVVENLLNAARIGAGQLTLKPRTCDLTQIVNDVTAVYADEMLKARCKLLLHAEAPVVGQWDPEQVERVVVNLVSNAIKFGAGSPIEISVTSEQGAARLHVRDHGIGIAKEDQGKMFMRFERVSPVNHFGGLGLGLYIAKTIVSAHGGSIEVESAPGQGACFVVRLPLAL
jgi:PAS domain S-box-containing protein